MKRRGEELSRALSMPAGRSLQRALAVAALSAAGLFALVAIALAAGATDAPDLRLLMLLRGPGRPTEPVGGPGALAAAIAATNLGGTLVLTLLSIAAGAWLLARRRTALAVYLELTMILGTALRYALKAAFARSRPDSALHQVSVDTFSFPSSHAMMSTVAYLTLGGLALRFAPARFRPPILILAVVLPLLVGLTRVYLGVHWPSDVLAGWAAGTAWAAASALVYETWRSRARRA